MYKGYGTSYSGYESNTKSAIKLQLAFDYLNQTFDQLNITEGIRSDQGYREHLSNISSNDLLILVILCQVLLNRLTKQELILLVVDTNIYDIETNQKMELLKCLEIFRN